MKDSAEKIYKFGSFRLNTAERRLSSGEESINLPPKVYDTLLLLIENAGRVVTKNEFHSQIWGDAFVEEGSLTVNISQLRKLLGKDVSEAKFIETVPRIGYRFVAPVEILETDENPIKIPVSDDENKNQAKENAGQISETNAEPNESEPVRSEPVSFWRLNRAAVLAGVAALVCLAIILFALSAFPDSSFADEELKRLQLIQLFTPETKPEGALLDINLSPDAKFIAFTVQNDGISKIYNRLATGGELIELTDGKTEERSVIWSPDGLRVAFLSARDGKNGIRTVSYLGGQSLFLVPLAAAETERARLVKWSADGRRIFFAAEGKLKTVEIESGKTSETSVAAQIENARNFKISPDEQWVVFTVSSENREQIWTQPLAGSAAARKIVDDNSRNESPSWFWDNSRIAFSSNRTGDFQIYATDASGRKPAQITFTNRHSRRPLLSPDGSKVFYVLAANFDND